MTKRNWDHVSFSGILILFGVSSLILARPLPGPESLYVTRDIQMTVAGLLLLYGTLRVSYIPRALGTILYITGLLNFAALVAVTTGSTAVILFLGLALVGMHSLGGLKARNEDETNHRTLQRRIETHVRR